MRRGVCAVDGCDRTVEVRDWCQKHYDRLVRAGEIAQDRYRFRSDEAPLLCGCDEPDPAPIGECRSCLRLVFSHSWHNRSLVGGSAFTDESGPASAGSPLVDAGPSIPPASVTSLCVVSTPGAGQPDPSSVLHPPGKATRDRSGRSAPSGASATGSGYFRSAVKQEATLSPVRTSGLRVALTEGV